MTTKRAPRVDFPLRDKFSIPGGRLIDELAIAPIPHELQIAILEWIGQVEGVMHRLEGIRNTLDLGPGGD